MTNQFGIDTAKIEHDDPSKFNILPTVAGRVIQVDADFIAHQVSYDDEKTLAEVQEYATNIVERLRLMAGAETAVLHLTPTGSNKGDRGNQAMLKPYQEQRKGKEKPPMLDVIRTWMHKERGAIMHMDCEADDGMATAQYEAIAAGNRDLSVIASRDKDLCIVPGLQMDCATGEINDTKEDFGFLRLDLVGEKKTKKVVGRGWKFFWAQMLMGDAADNISGLPKVCLPQYIKKKPKACGPVMAFDILAPVESNKEAFLLVRDLYKACSKEFPFKNYRDDKTIPYGDAFLSEARLLWMRRSIDKDDVVTWMTEHCV